jgi:hypothetical protein
MLKYDVIFVYCPYTPCYTTTFNQDTTSDNDAVAYSVVAHTVISADVNLSGGSPYRLICTI